MAFNVPNVYQAYMQALQQQFNQPQMTMPTIHADIIQVAGQDEVERYPVGVGASQMFMSRDDSVIYVKSSNANGYVLDVYERRPPAPPAPAFDPQTYVTREELEARLSAALAPKRGTKKEAEE